MIRWSRSGSRLNEGVCWLLLACCVRISLLDAVDLGEGGKSWQDWSKGARVIV